MNTTKTTSVQAFQQIVNKVDTHRGAPMGRFDKGARPTDKTRVFRRRVCIDSGGYDKGGAYWGIGAPLYVSYTADLSYIHFERDYRYSIMSKKEWIDMKKNNGCIVAKELGNRICFNRIKYNRMSGEEQTEYEKKCNQKVIKYRLYEANGTFYDISKAEYDYFNSVC